MPFLDNDGVTRLTTDYLDVFARKEDAILDPSGGLIRTDDGISVDSLTRESDGTISGSIVELTAEGHAEQFSTTGKNLLPNNATSQTVNGVTFTVNSDGSVTANGTATENAACVICDVQTSPFSLVDGSTYVVSGVSEGSNSTYEIMLTQENSGGNASVFRHIYSPTSFVFDASTLMVGNLIGSQIVIRSGATVNNLTFYPQLELGSEATDYEPYTGGAPSPSPDYPQEIQVVRWRNLLLPTTQRTVAGITITPRPDGSYVVNGTATANAIINTSFAEPLPAGTYTLSAGNAIAAGTSDATYIRVSISSSGVSQSEVMLNVANNARTFTVSKPLYMWTIRVASGDTLNNLAIYPQLEKGSTATPYVPYGYVGMEVHGKNLFDMSQVGANAIITGTNVHSPYTSATWWNVFTGTTGLGTKIDDLSKIMLLQAGTYTISGVREGGLFVAKVDDDGTYANDQAHIITMNTLPITFTIASPTYVTVLTSISITDFQIELGSTATPYEPYYHTTTPIPMPQRGWVAGLPDGTADSLRIDGAGKVQWELPTSEMVLDGSVSPWVCANSSASGYVYAFFNQYDNIIARNSASSVLKDTGLCDMLPLSNSLVNTNISAETINVGGDSSHGGHIRIGLLASRLSQSSSSAFATWLAENPVTVLYHLATPVTEDCGYVNMPTDIPEGATVTIPELDALGVKYFVDNSAGTLARQWYERADDESDASIDQRIELVESNIATIESTTAQSNHAVNSYFMLDNVLRKATSAIASGETISNSNSSPITVEQVVTALNNSVAALEKEVVFAITPSVSHRNIYRGKNLGTALTTAQKAQIAAGTFDDLYVGDYWTINGRVYRIADIDYYYNVGDTTFTKHHLVIVPDASFGNGQMNDSNTTAGAYVESIIYTSSDSVLNTARTTISNDFGNSLASHKEYLPNAVDSSGAQSTGAWYDSTVELMNEIMVYGCFIHAKPTSDVGHLHTVDKVQLAMFRLNPAIVNLRYNYWLRDVVSDSNFASVRSRGYAYFDSASNTGNGVRPFFCIVGD